MRKIGKFALGSLVGATLTLGVGGIASAASAAPSGGLTVTSTTPDPGTPTTTAPTTTGPTTTAPSTSTRPKRSHAKSSKRSKSRVLTGHEIWEIVKPGHQITCAHATGQLKRIAAADAAAARRGTRWQKRDSEKQTAQNRNSTNQSALTSRHLTKQVKLAGVKVRSWQTLQNDGQALIKKIEAKCPAAASSH
jgi:hypothetical protein